MARRPDTAPPDTAPPDTAPPDTAPPEPPEARWGRTLLPAVMRLQCPGELPDCGCDITAATLSSISQVVW